MKKAPEEQILINYLLGICTPNELSYVENWLSESPENAQRLVLILKELHGNNLPPIDKEGVKKNVFNQINPNSFQSGSVYLTSSVQPKSGKTDIFKRNSLLIKSAAMLAAFIISFTLTVQFNNSQKLSSQPEQPVLQSRTLSYGQTSTFRFSDGSVITLNGGSSLQYPVPFDTAKREVFLKGEAYFDIARDEARPFIVHVGQTTTQVLGTSFNIKAYQNDSTIQVTVVDGKVRVSNFSDVNPAQTTKEQVVLQKDEWATYRPSGSFMERGKGNIWENIAWKDQVLIFNNKPLSEVSKMLERWYGVDIILQNKELQNLKLEGEHKNMSLERVLQSIAFILDIDYSIDGQTVTFQNTEG